MTSAVAIVASALAAAAVLLAWPRGPALPSTARAGPR